MKPTIVTDPNMEELQENYDLTVPALVGLCKSTMDDTCCSCMKKKPCNDTGCSSQFGGQGINILNILNWFFSKHQNKAILTINLSISRTYVVLKILDHLNTNLKITGLNDHNSLIGLKKTESFNQIF